MKTALAYRQRPPRFRPPAVGYALACVIVLLPAFGPAARAQAQSYSVVYSFQCGPNDGEYPYGDLIADSGGNLYGTTSRGGAFGYGTVFEVSADGTETVLHSFAAFPTDGSGPRAGLVRDAAGNLYGTTEGGGPYDAGTVFELSSGGVETLLHDFTGGKDEGRPLGSLLVDPAGNLYGTTEGQYSDYYGTLFKLTPGGKITELHTFGEYPGDGQYPWAGVIQDGAANLYGTTLEGGANNFGTVFERSNTGVETVVYSFAGGSDGADPAANLVRDAAGNLYGTTAGGGGIGGFCGDGAFNGCGTVFKLTPAGQETVLYRFTGVADGGVPFSDLVMDPKGNLYGTASVGGSSSAYCTADGGGPACGVVFEVTATGKEKVFARLYWKSGRGKSLRRAWFASATTFTGPRTSAAFTAVEPCTTLRRERAAELFVSRRNAGRPADCVSRQEGFESSFQNLRGHLRCWRARGTLAK